MSTHIEPTITHGIARDLPRCQHALEVPLPDVGDGYHDSTLIVQCSRDAGHKGMHRHLDPITWNTPKESANDHAQ